MTALVTVAENQGERLVFTGRRDRSLLLWKMLLAAADTQSRLSAICSPFRRAGRVANVARGAFYFWRFHQSDALISDFLWSILNRGFWCKHYLNTSILKHFYPQSAVDIVNDHLIVSYILPVRFYFQFISKMTHKLTLLFCFFLCIPCFLTLWSKCSECGMLHFREMTS